VVREVAYSTLARLERRARHVAAARYFETVGDEELAGVLASHYLEAYRAAPDDAAAPALRAQARVALRGSAERAARLFSYDVAIRDLERALDLTDEPAEGAALLERLGDLAESNSRLDEAGEYARRSRDAYDQLGDRAGVGRSTARLGSIELRAGRNREARELLLAGYGDLEATGDPAILAPIAAQIGRLEMLDDRVAECIEWTERALVAGAKADLVAVIVEALNSRGTALTNVGRQHEGVALLTGAIGLAEAGGFSAAELRARFNLAGRLFIDAPAECAAILRAGIETAARMGRRDWHGAFSVFLADVLALIGRLDEAVAVHEGLQGQDLSAQDRVQVRSTRAIIALFRGDGVAAERLAREAAAEADQLSSPTVSGLAHIALAEVELALGRFDDVARRTRERILPLEGWRPPAWGLLGEVAVARGDATALREAVEARAEDRIRGRLVNGTVTAQEAMLDVLEGRPAEGIARFRDANRMLRDIEAITFVGRVLIGMVQALGPNAPESTLFAAEARAILEPMGAQVHLARLEEALRGATVPRGVGLPTETPVSS
jgi:tetratricopeptide (TPR) repeat protein